MAVSSETGETRDAVVVLRLWIEPHDPRVRARLLAATSGDGVVAVGIDEIVSAVRAELLRFSQGGAPGAPGG